MNRNEPRVLVKSTGEGRVALSIPHGHRVRTLSPKHARDLAGLLLEVADAADVLKAVRLSQPVQRNKPNASPAHDGLVRVSLGTTFVDTPPAEALRLADKLVDVVEGLEGRAEDQPAEEQELEARTPAPASPAAAEFARLADAAHEDAGQ